MAPKWRELFVYGLGLLGGGSRFGISRRPIFRRESDAPELRTPRGKFHSDFCFVAADRTEKHDATFLLFPSGVVAQHQQAAAGDARLQQHQRAMRVDGQCVGLFIEWLALRIDSVESNADLHQNALASAPRSGIGWVARKLRHERLSFIDYSASTRELRSGAGNGWEKVNRTDQERLSIAT